MAYKKYRDLKVYEKYMQREANAENKAVEYINE